jgi:hypothetical protein
MRRGWAVWSATLAVLTAGLTGLAQDPKQAVPANFRSFIIVDDRYPPKVSPPKKAEDRDPRDRTFKMHDLVAERGLDPTVAVLTRAEPSADSAAGKLAKGLDPLVTKHRANSFGAFVIFLTLDKEYPADERRSPDGAFLREVEQQKVLALAAQLKTSRVPFGLAARKSEATTAWGLGDGDETVVVIYDRMRVANRWAFPQGQAPTDAQINEMLTAADKVGASGK